jgi:hypothetical protein
VCNSADHWQRLTRRARDHDWSRPTRSRVRWHIHTAVHTHTHIVSISFWTSTLIVLVSNPSQHQLYFRVAPGHRYHSQAPSPSQKSGRGLVSFLLAYESRAECLTSMLHSRNGRARLISMAGCFADCATVSKLPLPVLMRIIRAVSVNYMYHKITSILV